MLALSGSGIRDTARVLCINTQVVMANRRRVAGSAPAASLRARPGYLAAPVRRRNVVVCMSQAPATIALVGGRSDQGLSADLCLRPAHPRHVLPLLARVGGPRAGGSALVY